MPPASTLARVLQHAAEFGVTRIANITGLDTIGLPVVMVRRPPPEPGEAVETVEAAVTWIAREHPLPRGERGQG